MSREQLNRLPMALTIAAGHFSSSAIRFPTASCSSFNRTYWRDAA